MEGKRTCFTWRRGKWEKFGDVLAEKKVTLSWLMNSNMVKPKKFDHLHLVYHFTAPLSPWLFLRGALYRMFDSSFNTLLLFYWNYFWQCLLFFEPFIQATFYYFYQASARAFYQQTGPLFLSNTLFHFAVWSLIFILLRKTASSRKYFKTCYVMTRMALKTLVLYFLICFVEIFQMVINYLLLLYTLTFHKPYFDFFIYPDVFTLAGDHLARAIRHFYRKNLLLEKKKILQHNKIRYLLGVMIIMIAIMINLLILIRLLSNFIIIFSLANKQSLHSHVRILTLM